MAIGSIGGGQGQLARRDGGMGGSQTQSTVNHESFSRGVAQEVLLGYRALSDEMIEHIASFVTDAKDLLSLSRVDRRTNLLVDPEVKVEHAKKLVHMPFRSVPLDHCQHGFEMLYKYFSLGEEVLSPESKQPAAAASPYLVDREHRQLPEPYSYPSSDKLRGEGLRVLVEATRSLAVKREIHDWIRMDAEREPDLKPFERVKDYEAMLQHHIEESSKPESEVFDLSPQTAGRFRANLGAIKASANALSPRWRLNVAAHFANTLGAVPSAQRPQVFDDMLAEVRSLRDEDTDKRVYELASQLPLLKANADQARRLLELIDVVRDTRCSADEPAFVEIASALWTVPPGDLQRCANAVLSIAAQLPDEGHAQVLSGIMDAVSALRDGDAAHWLFSQVLDRIDRIAPRYHLRILAEMNLAAASLSGQVPAGQELNMSALESASGMRHVANRFDACCVILSRTLRADRDDGDLADHLSTVSESLIPKLGSIRGAMSTAFEVTLSKCQDVPDSERRAPLVSAAHATKHLGAGEQLAMFRRIVAAIGALPDAQAAKEDLLYAAERVHHSHRAQAKNLVLEALGGH